MGINKKKSIEICNYVIKLVFIWSIMSINIYAYTIYDNGLLKFGDGDENSINIKGNLEEPQYKSSDGSYYRLTYSLRALDTQVSIGGTSSSEWNTEGSASQNIDLTNQVIDSSAFSSTDNGSKGYGTIISTGTLLVDGKTIQIKSTFLLGQNDAFIKVTTQVKNLSSEDATNVRFWVGTGDDYVGTSDSPTKTRGQLIDGEFVATTNSSTRSAALKISSGDEGVILYSSYDSANTVISNSLGFNNVVNINPLTSPNTLTGDDAYGLFVRLNDLSQNETDEFSWFYAAGAVSDLTAIINNVASASAIGKRVNEDTILTFENTDFVDDDSQILEKIKITSLPNYGVLQLNDINVTVNQEIASADYTTLTYTPNLNYNGNDSFNWQAWLDDGGGSFSFGSDLSQGIIILPINDSPTLETIFTNINIEEDNGISSLDVNITDVDLEVLTLHIESNDTSIITISPSWSGELNSSSWLQDFNLTTVENAHGTVEITVRVDDGELNSTKTFIVTITSVDDAPVLLDPSDVNKSEDAGSFTIQLSASDLDGDSIIYTAVSSDTSLAIVSINGNTLTVIPIGNSNGSVSIEVIATANGVSSTQIFTFNIEAVNDAPTVETSFTNLNIKEDNGTTTLDVNISDIDSQSLTLNVESNDTSIITVNKGWSGSLDSANWLKEFNLTTVENAHGNVEITITVDDGELNSTKIFTVNVDTVDDKPILIDPSDFEINEDSASFTIELSASDNDGDSISYTAVSSDTNLATISISGNILTVVPVANANGTVNIEVNATANGQSAIQTFSFNLLAVNDAPTIETALANLVVNEDSGSHNIELNLTDLDLDNLTLNVESNDTSILTITQNWTNPITNGNYENLDFNLSTVDNTNGVVSITVTVADAEVNATKTFTVNVNALNDAPTVETNFTNLNIKEDNGTTTLDVNISDIDSQSLTLNVESNDTSIITVNKGWSGSLDSANWLKEFNLTTVTNANGIVKITVTTTDGELNSTETFNITVSPVDDGISTGTNEDGSAGTVVAFDPNLNTDIEEGEDSTTANVTIGDKKIQLVVQNDGGSSGNMNFNDADGNPIKLSMNIGLSNARTSIDSSGNIKTTVENGDTKIETNLNADGSTSTKIEVNGVETEIKSDLKDTAIEVDENGTIVVISKVEKNGVIYKTIVTTDSTGKTTSKLIKIDAATGEEMESINTLGENSTFEHGAETNIVLIGDLVVIKVSTPINGTLTID